MFVRDSLQATQFWRMAAHEPEIVDNVSDVSSLHEDEQQEHPRQQAPPYRDHLKPQISTQQYVSPNPREEKQRRDLSSPGFAKRLETHPLGVWLVLLYSFAVIFSWTVTCFLSHRPIGSSEDWNGADPTYNDQSGQIWRESYAYSDHWRQAAAIGSAIVNALSIPVTSAICARATAVYCQRRSNARQPSLTLRQTLALADKGWTDLGVISTLMRPSTSRKIRSGLLLVSLGIVGLGNDEFILYP